MSFQCKTVPPERTCHFRTDLLEVGFIGTNRHIIRTKIRSILVGCRNFQQKIQLNFIEA